MNRQVTMNLLGTVLVAAIFGFIGWSRPELGREHAASVASIAMTRCFVEYRLLPTWLRAKRVTTRWLAEHTIVNFVITALTAGAVWKSWSDPWHSMDVERHRGTWAASPFPMALAVWLHAYHVVFYPLSNKDILHHALFVTLLAVPGLCYEWGVLGNAQLFWICGLPGGISYGLVVAQRCEHWLKIVREPFVTALCNLFLRCPGILVRTTTFCYVLWHGDGPLPNAPTWAVVLQLTLAPGNGLYYAYDSVRRLY